MVKRALAAAIAACGLAGAAPPEVARIPAPEADQGVAVDLGFAYAVDNSAIAKYARADGRKVGEWRGDPARFPHLNSCARVGGDLVCANSNYPRLPMSGSVEIFDPAGPTHRRSIPLANPPGSLTWVLRHGGSWWACFANYDGHGGQPGRDHTATVLVKYDDRWRRVGVWRFPPEVLARLAPKSASGGVFGDDGRLYVTGHDRPEVYALTIPETPGVLRLAATLPILVDGQAIAWESPRILWGVSRTRHEMVAMRLPDLTPEMSK